MARQSTPVRQRLLDAGDEVLFVDGSVHTPVDVICRAAGASPPSLYAHFGNKHGFLAAALRRRLDVWGGVWQRAIDATDDPVERVLAVFPALRAYQEEYLRERWCAFSATTSAVPDPSPELEAVLAEERAMLHDRVAATVADLPLESEAAAALVRQVCIAYAGTIVSMLREPDVPSIAAGEETARVLVEAALARS